MSTLVLALLALALVGMQAMIGGARLAYALPCYAVLAVAGLAAGALWKRRPEVEPSTACYLSTAALAGYLLVRNRLSPVEYLARPDFLLILGALVVYFLCARPLSSTGERFAILWVALLFGIAHFALSIFQFKDQQNFMLIPGIYRPDFGFRASGFYIAPNHLACLLGMLAVLALSVCCWSRGDFSSRALSYYGFVGCISGILLTGSRIGYLSIGCGLLAFGVLSFFLARYFNRPNFLGVAAAIGFVLACVAATALVFIVNGDFFEQRVRHVHDAPSSPAQLWPAARAQLALAPAFGTGAGTTRYFARQFRDPAVQSDPQHAHNDYLELLAEYGWVGGGLFAAFAAMHLVWAGVGLFRVIEHRLKPAASTTSNDLSLFVGAICAVVVAAVQSLRDFSLHLPGNALIAAFLFALLANPTVEVLPTGAAPPPPQRWKGLAAPLVALLLLVFSLAPLPSAWRGEQARVALRDGLFARAAARAAIASAGDPANADLCYYLGEARLGLALEADDPAEAAALRTRAAAAFQDGLKIFPQDVRLLLKLGRVQDQLGRFAEAEATYQQALSADPNSGTVLACYGLHWHVQHRLKKARELYEKAARLGETSISPTGLRDLEHDQAAERSNDPFAEISPEEE